MANITVLDDVVFALYTKFTSLANFFLVAEGFQVFQSVNFAANEAFFKFRVNHPSGLRCGCLQRNGPCSDLFLASCEIALQPQRFVGPLCDRA